MGTFILKRQLKLWSGVCLLLAPLACSTSGKKPQSSYVAPYENMDVAKEDSAKLDIPESELLDQAKTAYDQGLYKLAIEKWTSLREEYPGSYYATLAELKIADASYYSADYPTAIASYEEFIKLHPAHEAAAYARIQVGSSYREQYEGTRRDPSPLKSAIKSFERVIKEYPESEYVPAAKQEILNARGRLAEGELVVAKFYHKQGSYRAAANRALALLSDYPETESAAKTRDWLSYDSDLQTAAKDLAAGDERFKTALETSKPVSAGVALAAMEPSAEEKELKLARAKVLGMQSSPELSEAGLEERGSESTKRAKLSEPETATSVSSAQSAKVESPEISTANKTLLGLSCEEQNRGYLLTAQFAQELQLSDSYQDGKAVVALLSENSETYTRTTKFFPAAASEKHCEVGPYKLSFFSLKTVQPNKPPALLAKISRLDSQAVKLNDLQMFVIDRPWRLVSLLQSSSN